MANAEHFLIIDIEMSNTIIVMLIFYVTHFYYNYGEFARIKIYGKLIMLFFLA